MKGIFYGLIFGLLLSLALPSCRAVKDPEIKGIENFRIHSFGLKESSLSFNMLFFNPNGFRLKIKEAEGNAWLDGNLLGYFTVDTLVRVPALGNFQIPVRLKMDMSHFVENISAAVTDKQVTLKLDGWAKAGKGPVFINYPIRYEGKQKWSELIK